MNSDIISVIIPIYNVEKYLKECIDSIINQSYKKLEIILVNDGSKDNCAQICDEYARIDSRIKVIHKENAGLSSARNVGLDVATGEYICFVDSDDYVSPNFIEKLYMLCKKYDADISECSFLNVIDAIEKKEFKERIQQYTSNEMQKMIYTSEHVNTVVVWNKMYKKHIYEQLCFPVGKINEDEYTTYKAFANTTKNIIVTTESLYYYRYNENSTMGRRFNEKRLDVLDAYEEKKKYYSIRGDINLYEMTVEAYQKILMEYYLLTKLYILEPEQFLKEIFMRAQENYIEYKKISKKLKEKIKAHLFMSMPNLYAIIITKKRLMKG